MAALVEFKNVVKKYETKISVNQLSLTIEQGEIFGLLGPNGAGKTTTIHLLSGLLPHNSGEIYLEGFSVAAHPLEVKRRIGLVPQEIAIYENLSARENVTFFARLYGLRGSVLQERVEEALEFTGLQKFAKDKPLTFSGGMKRRLNIACAITHRPKLLIMDEPTVGIDPQSRNHILESVKKLNVMGSTIIYTSHYMEEVEAISTRIGIMDQGRLIACGTKDDLIRHAGLKERLMLQSSRLSDEAAEEIRNHPRVTFFQRREGGMLEIELQESQSYLQDILFILSKHGLALQKLTRVEPDLESLFLTLTGRTLRDGA
ncbi:antibiotic ABC transporter ATP-binding protein [Cohnella kolymensis]|uniref:Antibiotic ABC transporter ATP-binding protein n=1 Tax=Cohnella kolymensis TaxID=1590652 RepID=A0ABR5A566_9BACL|nr:ABC transporter ATP-binding protein [Cohnella kolymensis]KIL36196.1 antibiotic ABC transporter ATP-binding protein [Cohnella kolymensis]